MMDRMVLTGHQRLTDRRQACNTIYAILMRRKMQQVLSSSWDGRPFGHNRHRLKIGGGCARFGGARSYVTQCGLGRGLGLPACQLSSWSIQPFGHNTPTSQTHRQDRQTTIW